MEKTVKVFKGSSGFAEIYDDWLKLAKRCATHFLHYPFWYGAEIEAYCEQHPNVYFIAVYGANQLDAVIPLEEVVFKKSIFSFSVLEIFYSNEMGVCDVTSEIPLHFLEKDFQSAIKKISPWSFYVKFQGVCQNSLFARQTLLLGNTYKKHSHYSKYIDFSNGKDAFWSSYNSKFRRNLKRKISKAAALGDVSFVSESDPSKLPARYEEFLAIEDSGWKGKDKTSIKSQPNKKRYYQFLLDGYGKEKICHINLLYLSGKCIAAQFSLLVDQTLYLLKIGYDEEYSDISPGYLLLEKLVEYGCATKKFNRISFVTGVSWIDRWKPEAEEVSVSFSSGGKVTGYCATTIMKMMAR